MEGEFLARISVAEVSGVQVFSAFPGIDRRLVQLQGPSLRLTVDSDVLALAPLVPVSFAGEMAVRCDVQGEGIAHDLNLMTRRGVMSGEMSISHFVAGSTFEVRGAVWAVFALSDGAFQIISQNGVREDVRLAPRDLLLLPAGYALVASATGLGAVMRIGFA